MAVVFASPAVTPSAATPVGFDMSWTGWDGSVWSLTTREHGLVLGPGVRGLGSPPVQRYKDESPAVDGSRWRGSRTLEREVFWPLGVLHDSGGQLWANRDRAFWLTMDPEQAGQWTVTQPNGEYRTLTCRWASGDDAFDANPSLVGWAGYGIYLVAESPYWQGAPIIKQFISGSGASYYSASGSVYTRSASNLLSAARMSNPGDVDAWPTWTITATGAGITTVSVGVNSRLIVVPIALTSGQSVTINTNPAVRTAVRETGTDVTSSLGAVDFAPIPAGESQTLSLTMTGEGTVSASITPQYRRAW